MYLTRTLFDAIRTHTNTPSTRDGDDNNNDKTMVIGTSTTNVQTRHKATTTVRPSVFRRPVLARLDIVHDVY